MLVAGGAFIEPAVPVGVDTRQSRLAIGVRNTERPFTGQVRAQVGVPVTETRLALAVLLTRLTAGELGGVTLVVAALTLARYRIAEASLGYALARVAGVHLSVGVAVTAYGSAVIAHAAYAGAALCVDDLVPIVLGSIAGTAPPPVVAGLVNAEAGLALVTVCAGLPVHVFTCTRIASALHIGRALAVITAGLGDPLPTHVAQARAALLDDPVLVETSHAVHRAGTAGVDAAGHALARCAQGGGRACFSCGELTEPVVALHSHIALAVTLAWRVDGLGVDALVVAAPSLG